jgi:tetratricopeptide (TPR) repeat protein
MPTISPATESNQGVISMKPDSLTDLYLTRAMDQTYLDNYDAAIASLDSLILIDSANWPAYVMKAGIVYTRMTDEEEFDREDHFKALIDTALTGLNSHLKAYPDDKWGLFFKGTAMGYLALWEGHHGSWVKAVFKGLDAGKIYSKAVRQDSLFYEAYLGLGTLNYWRSAKMGFLRSLPFIPDKRELGIQQIFLAKDSSRYASTAAALGLAWIYIDRKEYRKAIAITDHLLEQKLTGRQILWPKGVAYFKMGYASGTIEVFSEILDSLSGLEGQNYYNIGLCEYYIGLANYWKGNDRTALKYLNSFLDREVDKKVKKRLSKKYKAAKKYKKKIKERIAEKSKHQID